MKKGAIPAQIFGIIYDLKEIGHTVKYGQEFKNYVIKKYNEIYFQTSKDTIISNLREDAMVEFQEERFITKLPQDNNKVDLMAVKIIDNVVSIIVSQQKGNNSSFNSTSLSKTLEKLSEFITKDKIKEYFCLLPDKLNPNINGLIYNVEVIIGMFSAIGSTTKTKNGENIRFVSNDDYLQLMGIVSNDIISLDYWVINKFNGLNHKYSAIDNCCNFDYIYDRCIQKLLTNGN
jgi:hypothetical protein